MNQNINDLKVLFLRTSKAKLNGREVKGRVYIVAMAKSHILLRSLDKSAKLSSWPKMPVSMMAIYVELKTWHCTVPYEAVVL